jgi:hypothetical protein
MLGTISSLFIVATAVSSTDAGVVSRYVGDSYAGRGAYVPSGYNRYRDMVSYPPLEAKA